MPELNEGLLIGLHIHRIHLLSCMWALLQGYMCQFEVRQAFYGLGPNQGDARFRASCASMDAQSLEAQATCHSSDLGLSLTLTPSSTRRVSLKKRGLSRDWPKSD